MQSIRVTENAVVYGKQAIPPGLVSPTRSNHSGRSSVASMSNFSRPRSRPRFSYGIQLDTVRRPAGPRELEHRPAPTSVSPAPPRQGSCNVSRLNTKVKSVTCTILPLSVSLPIITTTRDHQDWLVEAHISTTKDLESSKKEVEIIRYIAEEMRTREQNRIQRQREREQEQKTKMLSPISEKTESSDITYDNHNTVSTQKGGQDNQNHGNNTQDGNDDGDGDEERRNFEARTRHMSACREYARSRCHVLRDRLRQLQFWAHARKAGNNVPSKAPEDWRVVDTEWRAWLSEQTKIYHSQLKTPDPIKDKVSTLDYPSESGDPMSDVAWRTWGTLSFLLGSDIWGPEEW